MIIIRSPEKFTITLRESRCKGKSIGFVPTMGALHKGHLSLIRQARKENDRVAVSIFVNPVQFGPKEDFNRYPRPIKKDISLCAQAGVDFVFFPTISSMYPEGFNTYVCVEGLSNALCGRLRPGHFRGVATIVAKLFNIVNPDTAYFGQKDAQQAIIIKKMASDLNMPVKIKIMPTVREDSGLAMSSRNIYLSLKERQDAVVLYQALNLAGSLIKQGNRNPSDIIRNMKRLINQKKTVRIQYISIVDLKDLKPVDRIEDKVLIALAVWVGKTRLIDNIIINKG